MANDAVMTDTGLHEFRQAELQVLVVKADLELRASPGKGTVLVAKRLSANAFVRAMAVGVDEQLRVATELPDKIDAGKAAGIADGVTDLVQEHVDLVEGEVDLVLIAQEHGVAAMEKTGKRALNVFDHAARTFRAEASKLVR